MFKKSEPEIFQPDQAPVSVPAREPQARSQATIGSTIRIKGDVSGEENLTIEGAVEGTVTMKQHSLQIGKNGRLNADVHAKAIRVEGHVEGNLYAEEQVLVCQSGVVRGKIVTPRLTMEDGCSFKGTIDMESRASDKKAVTEPAVRPANPVNGSAEPGRVPAAEKKSDSTAVRPG